MQQAVSFQSRVLALSNNVPFGCERLQLADKALMDIRTHDWYKGWIMSSTTKVPHHVDAPNLQGPETHGT